MKARNYIDNFYSIFIDIYFVLGFIICEWTILLRAGILSFILGLSFSIVLIIMIIALSKRNYYLDQENLKINLGLFTHKYSLKDIKKCYITTNHKLSYATSKKRIGITFKNKKEIFISPEKMDEFLIKLINRGSKND